MTVGCVGGAGRQKLSELRMLAAADNQGESVKARILFLVGTGVPSLEHEGPIWANECGAADIPVDPNSTAVRADKFWIMSLRVTEPVGDEVLKMRRGKRHARRLTNRA